MRVKKYKGKKNISGNFIKKVREEKGLTKTDF